MTAPPPAAHAPLRRRLTWTAAIVLVSLGGAGLATAADRPATDTIRPELTAHSDRLAMQWIEALRSQAYAVDDLVDALSQNGRDVLAQLHGLDPTQIGNAVAAGDQASADLEIAAGTLADLRNQGPEGLQETRLSEGNRRRLAAVDAMVLAALPMPATWQAIAADRREVTNLLVVLATHDELVVRATSAGGREHWAVALDLLAQADAALGQARAVRDHLAATNDVSALDDLLARYVAYDAALTDMYSALHDGAALISRAVRQLSNRVDESAAALPADSDAFRVVEYADGGSLAEGVVDLEAARGKVSEAVAQLP